MVKVLFVCMGNICRSPTAEGVFRHLLRQRGLEQKVYVDSAGTHAYHIGEPPDPRAQEEARRSGIDLGGQRARRVMPEDFEKFDYVIAMDRDNLADLECVCPPALLDRLHLFTDLSDAIDADGVPDPYYGGPSGFTQVFKLVETGSNALIDRILEEHADHVQGPA